MEAETVDEELERELNKTIKKVTEDYESMKFNTAIAQMMTFINVVYKKGVISREDLKKFLTLQKQMVMNMPFRQRLLLLLIISLKMTLSNA